LVIKEGSVLLMHGVTMKFNYYDNYTQVECARIRLHRITECISPCTNVY